MPATAKVARRLAAKITQPRLARPLTRQRLHEVLDGMLTQHAVVWVAAPPGFGKTSLVSNYLESRSRQVMWYQVDERDEDIASFFHYLTLAAAQFDLPEAADLPRYSPEYSLGLTAFSQLFRSVIHHLTRTRSAGIRQLSGSARRGRPAPGHAGGC